MKIEIVGAGPAGLFAAILACRDLPGAQVRVWDRRAVTETPGYGLVLSEEGLAELAGWDAALAQSVEQAAVHWDTVELQFRDQWLSADGHAFSGVARDRLLQILTHRAREAGADLRFSVQPPLGVMEEADLVIAADGMHSGLRSDQAEAFGTQVQTHDHAFAWLGLDRQLPAFRYSFRRTADGVWILHSYPHGPGCSTLVVETHPSTLEAAGLLRASEREIAAAVQTVFAHDLLGGTVHTQGGWRRFQTVKNTCWYQGKRVLIGDAAHTAHFSVGSGTRLALADAAALIKALTHHPLATALEAYQAQRQPEVARMQKVAQVSRQWFEGLATRWELDPLQMQVSLLTRAKRITYDNLMVRDAPLLTRATRQWHHRQAMRVEDNETSPEHGCNEASMPPMFAPFRLRSVQLPNRVVVSPMAQYSALNGCPSDWHLVHYGSRAVGGAGLVWTEMTCVSDEGRVTPGCAGLYMPEHVVAWRRVVEFVHAHSHARIGVQLGHAGRKGSTRVGWEGIDQPLPQGNWPLLSASALPYIPGLSQVPRAMTREDMDRVIAQFEASTAMAVEAGFDLLELHMAHGYLLASFLSPITNQRPDEFGGSLNNRLRFPMQVYEAVRACWPSDKPIAIRLSAVDWMPGGNTQLEAIQIARAFRQAGVDLIDVSSGQTDPQSKPEYGRMYQAGFSEAIRLQAGVPTIAVGAVAEADQINTLLLSGRADLVALGRPHLEDPFFTLHAAARYGYADLRWPVQYEAGGALALRRQR